MKSMGLNADKNSIHNTSAKSSEPPVVSFARSFKVQESSEEQKEACATGKPNQNILHQGAALFIRSRSVADLVGGYGIVTSGSGSGSRSGPIICTVLILRKIGPFQKFLLFTHSIFI
jgi:hypothetical protein